jgi:hypothetical protein
VILCLRRFGFKGLEKSRLDFQNPVKNQRQKSGFSSIWKTRFSGSLEC